MQRTKPLTGPKKSPFHCPTIAASAAGPAPQAHPGCLRRQGYRSPLRAPHGRAEKSFRGSQVGSGRGGTRARNRRGEERPGLRSAAEELLHLQPSLASHCQRRAAPGCSLERHRAAGDGSPGARPIVLRSRFQLLRGAWAQPVVGEAFFLPGLSRLRTSPAFLLSRPFLSPELAFPALSPASASGLRPSTQLSLAFTPQEWGWSDHRTPTLPASQPQAKPLAQLSPDLASP